MPFTADEIANIANSVLDARFGRGKVYAQNIQSKPLVAAMDRGAKTFPGGKGDVTLSVKSGQGGLSLSGYEGDDQLSYGNPTGTKQAAFTWKEHFIGMGLTHTELKKDGITVLESGADQSLSMKDGREEQALANLMDEKVTDMNEDYVSGWNTLLWGDGTADTKAIAGIQSLLLADPGLGYTGGLPRASLTWWRNRAATAAANAAGTGNNAVTSATAGGGALLKFLEKERPQVTRYARRTPRYFCPCGSDFLDAMKTELRANGQYTQTGFGSEASNDASMASEDSVRFGRWTFTYDPTLDDLSLAKRAYGIDLSCIHLQYMAGEKKKRANPARPHDRFVLYRGVSTTAVMVTNQLNTSFVYDIA